MGKRIVLADDHKILREGLRHLLETNLGHSVVGEADTGEKAVELVKNTLPDLVIMDLTMPGMNGIEATCTIHKNHPTVKILALSMHSEKRFVSDMLIAGASAYLLKDCAFEEIEQALESIFEDGSYVSNNLRPSLLDDYVKKLQGRDDEVELSLTQSERRVLRLLAEGFTTKEIASELSVSSKTIDTHRSHLMEKLGVGTVAALVKYALRKGLTTLDQ
ncbi:MAG: response regulator transcription factor [bacterium]